jgi:hypothetical protein
MSYPTEKSVIEHVSSASPTPTPTYQPKGPGHIDIHEVDEDELDKAEATLVSESEFTPKEYSRLRWKLDLVIMPILMIMYGLQYSDKVALSQGVVFNLREDTHLVGNQYADLTTFFYVGYLVAQL